MVEIPTKRYEELLQAETTLHNAIRILRNVPSWKVEESLKVLLMYESEVKADAE